MPAAKSAIASMQLADELEATAVAAEPALQNAVAFDIDERGRFFVAESFRAWDGVPDIRPIRSWQDDDLACRSVEDRLAMMIKHAGDITPYTLKSERIRRLADTDGDGVVDEVITFAEGFNDPLDGIAAGIYVENGQAWFTCIPKLWRLEDADDDGVAESRDALHHGYGVHINLLGHDFHGVIKGPDGKLYFSIGDRGINVPTDDGRLVYPDEGSVMRCNPDGSELELFARGMRNPQELAFDDYGNLFTVDNDADGEDSSRFIHIVRGLDAGWHIGHQWVGPSRLWNREKMWQLQFPDQPAHILPPGGFVTNGPSGFAAFPGTGLPNKYDGHFFVADFTGAASNSGILGFRMQPLGATFRMEPPYRFAWGMVPTDVDFGIDGGVYILDWVGGYSIPDKSRIYRVADAANLASTETQETTRILAEGIAHRDSDELAILLAHADRRIRQAAQFELVKRGESERLLAIALNPSAYRRQYVAAQQALLSDESDQSELSGRQLAWAQALRERTRWSPIHPTSARSKAGVLLSIQPDGAVLAGGPAPQNDTVTLAAPAALDGITAIRLDALPHASLPANGPGRAESGDFVLSTVSFAIEPLVKPDPEPVLGRRIRVQLMSNRRDPLTLAEFQVWSDGTNIALAGTATQCSLHSGGSPERAIDGNTDGAYNRGTSTHTNHDENSWWELDLGYEQPIDSITLWNRTDCCASRLSEFRVTIFNDVGKEIWTTDVKDAPNPKLDITVRDAGITQLAIEHAEASFERSGFPASNMLGVTNDYDGWGIDPRPGEPHSAIFHLAEPLSVPGGARLRITMAHDYWQDGYTLGHFRFSSTTSANPTLEAQAPPEILRIVDIPAAERDPAESAALADYYAHLDPFLAQARARLAQLEQLDEVEIWFDDALPEGGASNPPEAIEWVDSPVHSGHKAHRLKPDIRANQHYFDKASAPLTINHLDDEIFVWVHPSAERPPTEILIQIHSYNWEHRAYWGENRINWGKDKTASRLFHGPVPLPGVWTQLRARAGDLGFYVGDKITGMGFAREGGEAVFDEVGIIRHNETRRAAKLDLARLHAIWGLGQLNHVAPLEPLLNSADPEIRGQIARLFGEKGEGRRLKADMLADPNPRVRFHATHALPAGHKMGNELIAMLEQNRDVDVYLRFAAARALARADGWQDLLPEAQHSASAPRYISPLFKAAAHEQPWVRRAAVIGFRYLQSPLIAPLLNDGDRRVQLEAARAVYDCPIPEALPALAELLPQDHLHNLTYERALHANYRLGQHQHARRLAEFALHERRDHNLRATAIDLLLRWKNPPLRDFILGLHRPLPERDPGRIASVIARLVAEGLDPKHPEQVRIRAARCVGRYKRLEQADAMYALATDPEQPVNLRVAAAQAMHKLEDLRTARVVESFINDSNNKLASEGNKLVGALPPATGARVLASRLRHPSVSVRQSVIEALGSTDGDAAAKVLSLQLDELLAGTLDPALELDLIEACELRKPPKPEETKTTDISHGSEEEHENTEEKKAPGTSPELLAEIADKLATFTASRAESADEPLGPWLVARAGGDPKAGETIFFHRQDVQCSRCHFVRGRGAPVGPDLSRIGDEQDARTLIESTLLPSAQLAKGFDAVPISAMPPIMKDALNTRDLRDLVAYLMTLKPRAADPPKDALPGIEALRFEGNWDRVPNLGNNPIEVSHVADFAAATRHHRKGHAWKFNGYLTVADDDWYTIGGEGIASFKIDNEEWIQSDPNQPPKKIALRPGAHSFTAIYVGSDAFAEFAPTLNGQRIRPEQLSRGITVLEPANPVAVSPGVDYLYYNKGAANHEFGNKRPDKVGFAEQLDFSMSEHTNHSAVQFSGYVDVPADGEYSIFVDTINECELRIGDTEIIAWNEQAGDLPETSLLTNFDGRNFGRWRVEGRAFGRAPATGPVANQQVQDAEGGIANSLHGDKQATGKLISPDFVIQNGYIAFKIGGGKNKAKLGLRLFVDGEKVREAVGENGHKLVWKTWAVKEFAGKTAHLEIVDEGEQGFILVDTIVAVDKTKRGSAYLRQGRHAFTLRAKYNPVYLDRSMRMRIRMANSLASVLVPLRLGPEPGQDVPHLAPGVHITQMEGRAGNQLSELAKFAPKATVIGDKIDIEKRPRDHDFALTLRGYLKIETPGEYRFWIKSDDGSRFHLNGRDLMVWDGSHGHEPGWPGRALLGSGLHPFRVDMFNGGGKMHLGLWWEGPGIEKAEVPASALFYRSMRAAEEISDLERGLDYAYYESGNQPWQILPDFANLRPIATGVTPYPALDVALRADRFGLRFTGYIRVPESGEYRFTTNSDDGSRLWIGDELIVDNDGQHGPQDRLGIISLEAGHHPITIDFFEAGSGESLSISIQRDGGAREALPAEWLWRR